MRLSRDLLVVGALFALLIGFTLFSAMRRAELESQQSTFIPYSTHSAQPSGTLALQSWLDAIGYRTARIENETFKVPDEARVLFIFPARVAYEEYEAQAVLRWVERGNTLIVTTPARLAGSDRLLRALRITTQPLATAERVPLAQPLAGALDDGGLLLKTSWGVQPDRADYVTYASAGNVPVIVGWAQGRGRVYVASSAFPFSNDGLRTAANAALARALLPAAGARPLIAFDEYHLGFSSGQSSLQNLIYNTPWGWALLFSAVVIFAYLIINGQHFGRVEPLPIELARRSPAEYATSMAALFRRAGKRQMVMNHYRQQLKRSLGRPYRINASLPDAEFVAELARYRDVDRGALLRTLHGLAQPNTSERVLVRLADEAVKLRNKSDGA
ncbi:MAG: DUF4350 domain-containing protein [Chloroflexi bacterium]|nr:DUF4350 domain-containing protein [Chloroflexota bacterium]